MILKWVKIGVISAVGVCLVGGVLFGRDLVSYMRSSAKSVRTAVKDSVPIEFELRRARDLLEDIIPEMQANIRLIAHEEVEVTGLEADVERCSQSIGQERVRIGKVRDLLNVQQVAYVVGNCRYTRQQLTEDLSRRFGRHKEAQAILAGKQRLLATREKSLEAAKQMLARTRAQKVRLQDQIEALESQFRLVKAASVGSHIQVDNSKLAQTEKLIRQIKKRLDVAERVLAHETQFVQPIPIDTIDEKDLLTRVDEYLAASDVAEEASTEDDRLALCEVGRDK